MSVVKLANPVCFITEGKNKMLIKKEKEMPKVTKQIRC